MVVTGFFVLWLPACQPLANNQQVTILQQIPVEKIHAKFALLH